MNKTKLFIYAVLSGLLLIPAWYEWGHGLLLFIALVPMLAVEDYIDKNRHQYRSVVVFYYAYLAFLIWNAATTWWIFNATPAGMVFAILVNTLLLSLVFWAFHIIKRRLGAGPGYFSLIVFWITFEHFYFNAEISWPWLTLGYGFIFHPRFIQWYDTTGVLGGSLWVLLGNILIYSVIRQYQSGKKFREYISTLVMFLLVLLIPVVISFTKYYSYREQSRPYEMVVLQPNIDPYSKFLSNPFEQTLIQIELADGLVDSATQYVIGPETSINNYIWLDKIESVPDIKIIRSFLMRFPELKYVVGAQCFREVTGKDTLNHTARLIPGTDKYYQSYNAALQIDSTRVIQHYFKSQLVVGVEKMPYARYLRFLNNLIIRLGGTTRGWAAQKEREVFISPQDSVRVAPVICWESVFGEYVTEYIKKGANFIFVITNDGWWRDTPGYRQHNGISRIRAIETRRSIARSANTGISCFINQRGDVLEQLGWWQKGALKGVINANNKQTFYVRHGDYIGRIARFFSLIMIIYFLVELLMRRRRNTGAGDS